MVSSLLNGCVPVDFLAAESVGKGGVASRWIGVNMPVLGKKKYLVESWSLSGKATVLIFCLKTNSNISF